MNSVFIKQQDDSYQWFFCPEQAQRQAFQGSLEQLAEFYQAHTQIKQWVLVLSALDVAVRKLRFQAKERRHIIKAVPFLLEDELLSDADALHIVHGKLNQDSLEVCALDKQLLEEKLAAFQTHNIRLSHCMAECQLFIDEASELSLQYQDNYFVLQRAGQQTLAFDAGHLALSLEILTDNFAKLPNKVLLYVEDDAAKEQALAFIPSTLQHLVEVQMVDFIATWQEQFKSNARIWNFLQGRFAQKQQWLLLIKPWRWLITTLLIALVLNTSLLFVDYQKQKNHYQVLQNEMTEVFRKAFPVGQIVDYHKQLSRLLESLEGGGGNQQAFIVQLEQIGKVLAEYKIQSINSLNFDQDKAEVRLDFVVQNYDQLQTVINQLKQQQFNVEIQNSNAQGEQLRARLRITP